MTNDRIYLTRLVLNQHHPDARRDLNAPADMHRTLMRLIPDHASDTPRATAGLLYRLEHGTQPVILAQSTMPVSVDNLPTRYTLDAHTTDITDTLNALQAGQDVNYTLVVNPTRSTPGDPATGKRGKRFPLTNPADIAGWWHTTATRNGLLTTRHAITPLDSVSLRRPNGTPARITGATITGTAIITDPDTLRAAIRTGIGRGRSWGYGLLSLNPSP